MTKRTCENCRWWKGRVTGYGYCHKRPPIVSGGDESFPSTHKSNFCGEWSDASITPEQEDMQELTRRFAVAIMSTQWAANCPEGQVWAVAASLATAEPQIQRENEQ
jgi:hypothetical protein